VAIKTASSVEVGRRLRALRELRGIPKERVALDLAMSSENWRHYETGRNHLPASMLPLIAETYGMSLVDLVSALFDAPTSTVPLAHIDTLDSVESPTENKPHYSETEWFRIAGEPRNVTLDRSPQRELIAV